MLRALQSRYHGVVQVFCLGCHSLPSSTLQSVVDQCMAYNKDPWKGLVGKDGKAWTPSANMAGASGDGSNPYNVLPICSFKLHMSRWCNGCKDGSDKYMVCHNTPNKPAHHSKDCPILGKIGLNLSNKQQQTAGTVHLEPAKPCPLQPCQPLHLQLWVLRPIVRGLPQHPGPPRP
jgi:hypothetical protein